MTALCFPAKKATISLPHSHDETPRFIVSVELTDKGKNEIINYIVREHAEELADIFVAKLKFGQNQ